MIHINIDPNVKPVHAWPYPVSHVHLGTFKSELDHLVKLGVSVPQQESEQALLIFIVAKKDGHICWIGNLQQSNKVVWCTQYPLQIITNIQRNA